MHLYGVLSANEKAMLPDYFYHAGPAAAQDSEKKQCKHIVSPSVPFLHYLTVALTRVSVYQTFVLIQGMTLQDIMLPVVLITVVVLRAPINSTCWYRQ